MFESSVVPTAPRGRWSALLSVSTALQLGLIAAAVIIPMAHVSALPPVKLVPRPPMPKLAHVKLVPMDESIKRAAMATGARVEVYRPRVITAPTRVPDKPAARIFDDVGSLPPGFTAGEPAGSRDGVPTIADFGQRVAGPPPPAPKPPTQTAKPATPKPVPVGGNVRQPKLIREVRPPYPPLARQARIQGVVKITAIVSRDGTVQSLQVVSGHPLLVAAALDAVRQWIYEPTLLNGAPVEVVLVVDVNFRLSN